MYSFFPDEIVKEILAPALQISEQAFGSIDDTSPFAKYEGSTSALLLVCKGWLRVATPLLYNVVILRSKAQIQALAWTLDSNSQLGNFIKKLRIECGYDSSLFRVFQTAKNLSDLCLSLEIYSKDDVSGICKGMMLVQPRRVTLYNPTVRPPTTKVIELVNALSDVIPSWTHLTTFILPPWRNKSVNLGVCLKQALCSSPSLQKIYCSEEDSLFAPEFANIPTIKAICVRKATGGQTSFEGRLLPEILRTVKEHPELADLVAFEQEDESGKVISLLGIDSPVATTPGPPSDWLRKCSVSMLEKIIFYAMGIPSLKSTNQGYLRSQTFSWYHNQHLGLVCKKFHDAVRHLGHKYVVIHRQGSVRRLAQQYRVQPELGDLVQWLFIHPIFGHSDDARDLAFVLSCCPNLRQVVYIYSNWTGQLGVYSFRWEGFSALASCSGHKLFELQVTLHGPDALYDPAILHNFTSLRNLCWNSDLTFDLDCPRLSGTAFQSLESLACITKGDSFLRLMSLLDLPRIHSVYFPEFRECPGAPCFLEAHGTKFQYLQTVIPLNTNIFKTCPNLKILSVPDIDARFNQTYPTATTISCSQKHPLEEIRLEASGDKYDFYGFLGDLNLSSFPCFRRIRVSRYTWPCTENSIKKSCWVSWAERLKNGYDVDMVDSSGKVWIPRLKTKVRRSGTVELRRP